MQRTFQELVAGAVGQRCMAKESIREIPCKRQASRHLITLALVRRHITFVSQLKAWPYSCRSATRVRYESSETFVCISDSAKCARIGRNPPAIRFRGWRVGERRVSVVLTLVGLPVYGSCNIRARNRALFIVLVLDDPFLDRYS